MRERDLGVKKEGRGARAASVKPIARVEVTVRNEK